jgi:oligopeptide transport system substrate-binding protein
MKLGLVFHTAFDYERSLEAYEEGFDLWKQAEEAPATLRLQTAPHALRTARGAPISLDPTMTDHNDSSVVNIQLFSGLVEGSAAREVIPDVARSWEISEGGRRYTFHLRDDVCWSDGAPVTSEDFEFAWKRTLDPDNGSPNANLLYDIKGARAYHQRETTDPGSLGIQTPDALTLAVELEGPTGYFLSLLACTAAYPVPQHVVEAHGEAWTQTDNLVTNGAFTLEDWRRGESMVLLRNTDYHGRFKGNLERVELLFGIKKSDILGMYEDDTLDILGLVDFPSEQWDHARRRYAWEYISAPESATHYVGLDVSRPPFDDPRVRRAFALAIDKTTLANKVLGGYLFPAAGGFIPPSVPGHVAGIGLPYDPEQAQNLLAEAGYPGGHGFPKVEACARDRNRPQTEYIQVQWRENLGVDVAWEMLPWRKYLDRLEKTPANIVQFGWMADYPDPDSFLRTGNTQQRTRWRDETYDELVEKARRVMDQEERLDLYAQADKILVEAAAVIPLAYSWSHTLVKPWVSKFPALALNEWLWKDIIIEPH